ncbi:hypothetical protein HPB47_017157 [Ixodes persulcatus]|uniref:Uncharacterized protein n=1 Tax=Ixodes persulcatus TaxID=34615 RepID=A0AC60QP16_IXOPE|nr:hypothetical protein HPB47_017157 [Ixodes persulcatus]
MAAANLVGGAESGPVWSPAIFSQEQTRAFIAIISKRNIAELLGEGGPRPSLAKYDLRVRRGPRGFGASTNDTESSDNCRALHCSAERAAPTSVPFLAAREPFGLGVRVTNLTILCSTNRLEGSHPGGDEAHRVTLMIDGQEVPYLPTEGLTATFSYKPNPVVNKIVPASAPFKGRSKILVLGKNLDSVAKPVMVIRVTSLNYRHHENISKECVPADDSHSLACPVASLFDSSVIPRNELQNHRDAIWVHVHFQMDGLRLPERAAGMGDSFKFVYRPPPKFDPFPPGGLNVLANDPTVLIRGHNFEVLEHDDEFSVKIDDVDNACKVINITSTTIGCVYNIYEESDGAAHTVDVVMGNETFRLGTLKLVSGQASCHTDTISGVVIAVFVLTSIVVGSFFYYKRRQPNKRTPGYLSNYVRGNEADARQALIASSFQLDNKTKAMLEAEKLLFKRDFLTLGPVIGQG